MTTRVRVNMNLCGYVHNITASSNGDGTYAIKIESPCEKVRKLDDTLESLSLSDLSEWSTSRLLEKMKECNVGLHCSVPAGIMNAAELEAGFKASSLAKRERGNSWEFVFE